MHEHQTELSNLLKIREMEIAAVIRVLRAQNLLGSTMVCTTCGEQMAERKKAKVPELVAWCCINKSCSNHKTTKSIRHGSFFARYKHSLGDIWTVMVSWLYGTPAKRVCELYALEKQFVLKIMADLRELVAHDLESNPFRLGGGGIVCQVDESHLAFHSKYGVGRQPDRQQWVFGIVDTSYTPAKGYAVLVPNRTREVLLGVISRVCLPGTIIHSDCWAAYRQIQNSLGLEHHTVNHKYNFVDPQTGVHTQHVESYWNRIKRQIKEMNGLGRASLSMFVSEFVWKDYHRERKLISFIGLLSVLRHQ